MFFKKACEYNKVLPFFVQMIDFFVDLHCIKNADRPCWTICG